MRWKDKKRHFKLIFCLGILLWILYHCVKGLMQETTMQRNLGEIRELFPITRDPKRKIVYTYNTGHRIHVVNTTIDISKGSDLSELDSRIVIVSGFMHANSYNGLGMITSIQAHMPNKRIIIYNLGISSRTIKTMKAMCNVEVRTFNYKKYPKHVQQVENGAWKLLAITEVLEEHGVIFFVNPRIRFRAPINILLPYVKEHHGIIGNFDPNYQTSNVTHLSMYKELGLNGSNVFKSYPKIPILSGDALFLVNNSEIYSTMLQPLKACASRRRCIAPTGSTRKNVKPVGRTHTHHYEMSAFSLLMYHNFQDKWVTDMHVHNVMNRIQQVVPDSHVNDHQWAHFCNPPQKEKNCKLNGNKC